MLFSQTIDNIDSEISELLAQIEAKKQKQSQLIELDALTDNTLEGLADVLSKIKYNAPDAIASLKSAVMGLFPNDGNDGGDQREPSPEPDDKPDSGEVMLTDATSVDESEETEAINFIDEDCLEYPTLEGQCCNIEQELEFYWERLAKPEGQAWEFACPLKITPPVTTGDNENKCTHEGETVPYIELVEVTDAIAYQKRSATGEVICTYLGFATKGKAVSWQRFIETMTPSIELRQAKRLERCKWEIKAKGLSITQIQRLSEQDFSKAYKPEAANTEPPAVQPNEFEPGDVIVQSLTPSASFKIEEILPNGVLDCTNLTTGDRLGLRPSAVQLVEKANVSPKQTAKILLKDCQWYGQSFPIVQSGKSGYTLATPNGNHWFRADCVEVENSSTYQVTTGNYVGTARQNRKRWKKLGIDPQELLAEMKAKRPPEPEWNAAKYNPLAAVGADDASDF